MTTGLVLIDIQNDYFKGGGLTLVGIEEAAHNCRRLLEHFRKLNLPIFHVQQLSLQAGAPLFVPYTKGCEIHDLVKPQANETLVIKHYPNSFRETILQNALQKAHVTHLVVCGAMSHMCVDTTVRAAFDLGYVCTLISDACATRDLEFAGKKIAAADVHASFMSALSYPFATTLTTQQFLISY